MSEEQIQNRTTEEESDKLSIMDILLVLRSRWLIILIITVLFAIGGYVYARVRKPVYTASGPVTFKTTVEQVEKENGEYKAVQDGVSSTNYLYAYLDTAVAFCVSGNTIDRANVYYAMFMTEKRNDPDLTVDEFVSHLKGIYAGQKDKYKACLTLYVEVSETYNSLVEYYKNVGKKKVPDVIPQAQADATDYDGLTAVLDGLIEEYEEIYELYQNKDYTRFPTAPVKPQKIYEITGYEVDDATVDLVRDRYITAQKAGTANPTNAKDSQYSSVQFDLTVKDYDGSKARELVRIFALAADVAVNKTLRFDARDDADTIATAGLYEMVNSSGGVKISSDGDKTKIVVIAALLGIVVSLLVVYVSYIADTTVKSREVLEKITGTSVIAYIDDVGENK